MPQITSFFPHELTIFWSAKHLCKDTFFPHPPSPFPGNFCNCSSGGINCFQILGSAFIVIHSVKQHILRNQPRSDAVTSRDFLHERLQRAFTHANQLHWTARNTNWQFADMEYACGLGFFLGVCQFCCCFFVLFFVLKVKSTHQILYRVCSPVLESVVAVKKLTNSVDVSNILLGEDICSL